MDFERGFKSWAERTSASFRRDIGLQPHSSLDPAQLANHLDVQLCTPHEIPGLPQSVLDQLLRHDPSGWSAVSIYRGDRGLIIYNSTHSKGRQASDIMHELAHLVLDHQPATLIMSQDGSMVMRSYNQKQEDEANWLAWTLLLPREALMRCKRRGLTIEQTADEFGVTVVLVRFRLRVTGVDAQMRAIRRRSDNL
jgi:Zn-dependent peptidase ImmA (M78 family)